MTLSIVLQRPTIGRTVGITKHDSSQRKRIKMSFFCFVFSQTAGLLFSREIEPMSEGARKRSADTPRKPLSESQILKKKAPPFDPEGSH